MKPAAVLVALGVFILANSLNAATLALNASTEQCRLLAYDDKQPYKALETGDRILGTLTIGYGHTRTNPFAARALAIGDAWTQEQANQQRLLDLKDAEAAVEKAANNLNDNQFGALVDFVFNVGVGGFLESKVYRALKVGNLASIPALLRNEFLTVKGRIAQGLVIRREKEAALFASIEAPVVAVASLAPATAPSVTPDSGGIFALLHKAKAMLADALSSMPGLDDADAG